MSQISIITTPAPVTAGVDSITGNTGGALTGALNLGRWIVTGKVTATNRVS